MKQTILLSFLFLLFSCNDGIIPQENEDKPAEIEIPVLGQKITVAYVHLKSLSYDDINKIEIRNQIRDLLDKYDILYTFIEAGEGLRYWDFGLIGIENNLPIRNWTTGDYNKTRKWNYISHREAIFQDSSAFDYNFEKYGYSEKFEKTPFGMHYYSKIDSRVRLNIIGANIDPNNHDNEILSLNELLINLNYWENKKTIAFGNFTKNCENKLINALIIQTDECKEQSVWISPELKKSVESITLVNPEEANTELISEFAVVEVLVNI